MPLLEDLDSDGILTITMSRPESLNSLNKETMAALDGALQKSRRDASVRGLILTGDGEKAFVAGADIRELSSLGAKEALELSHYGQHVFGSIENSVKPVIGAINGFALGGGCELAMACHIRIATENARFGQPEVNLGIIPGYGGTQRLTQLVGRGKALELLLTGDMITANEALSIGLVNHVVADREALTALSRKIMQKMLSKGPVAIARAIAAVNSGFGFEQAGYQAEAEHFAACSATADFREGTMAFVGKRTAVFKGI